MRNAAYSLAIETSCAEGSVSLGRNDTLLATTALGRGRAELMPAVAKLCEQHDCKPGNLAEVYVSLGPGSFTGLRVALAAVKMLAMSLKVKVAGIATLDVLACSARSPKDDQPLLACLNVKRGTAWCGTYRWDGTRWRRDGEPGLREMTGTEPGLWTVEQSPPTSEAVWRLGRERSKMEQWDDAWALSPIYAREPEAVRLWQQRHAAVRPSGPVTSKENI
ncbi:MAG: tRNA (adenosine(37)-N6)-threonylcarbamoyltransferase complex dimerization subunit type 1 TsaB [Phycisphaeraceae bacterium]|nr:tRNA (adenosine(37)-N6)-threonylcarbamoyltransferase complex dimerization subunit type 1 TsaB [Phycisphaeraceae bacterium]